MVKISQPKNNISIYFTHCDHFRHCIIYRVITRLFRRFSQIAWWLQPSSSVYGLTPQTFPENPLISSDTYKCHFKHWDTPPGIFALWGQNRSQRGSKASVRSFTRHNNVSFVKLVVVTISPTAQSPPFVDRNRSACGASTSSWCRDDVAAPWSNSVTDPPSSCTRPHTEVAMGEGLLLKHLMITKIYKWYKRLRLPPLCPCSTVQQWQHSDQRTELGRYLHHLK